MALRGAGLVSVEKDGVRRFYQLLVEGLEPLRRYVSSFWDEALDAYRRSFDDVASGEGSR